MVVVVEVFKYNSNITTALSLNAMLVKTFYLKPSYCVPDSLSPHYYSNPLMFLPCWCLSCVTE